MRNVSILGTPTITIDGDTARIGNSKRAIALLTYLVLNGEPISREKVADMLWEDVTTSQSLRRLRELIGRVRTEVPELATTRRTVWVERTNELSVDYWTLDAGLHSGNADQLKAALLAHGKPLLADFTLTGKPPFNAWLVVQREQYRLRLASSFRQLHTTHVELGQWAQAIEIARLWVAFDDLDEEAQRALIQSLFKAGQGAAALEQFAHMKSRLARELRVDPEPLTVELADTIKRSVRSVENGASTWNGRAVPEPSALPSWSVVPFRRNQDFVGRNTELRAIGERLLIAPDRRPLVLSGIGGVGKTQLVVEFAYRFGRFFDAVYWLNFASRATAADDAALIGGERGMQLYNDEEKLTQPEKVARVQREWQTPERRLLIFDNCTDEQLLADWLPVTGGATVLITSTRPEWPRAVAVDVLPLDVLERPTSIQFLQQLATRLNAADADSLASVLGDLPLALQLAGGYLGRYQTMSAAAYLRQLEMGAGLQHPSLLGQGTKLSATQHALSVSHAFELSYQQLTLERPVEHTARRMLTCIAHCTSAETLPYALVKQFVPEVDEVVFVDALVRLRELGLLIKKGADDVTIHRLIAQFVRDQDGGDSAEVRSRITKAMCTVLQQKLAVDSTVTPLPFAATQLEATIKAALADGIPQASELAGYWANYLVAIVATERIVPYADQIIDLVNRDEIEQAQRVAALRGLAYALEPQGRREQARNLLEDALNIQIGLEGELHSDTATSFADLGIMALQDGAYEQARRLLFRSTAISEQLERVQIEQYDPYTHGYSLLHIGLTHIAAAEHHQGKPFVTRALALYRTVLEPPHVQLASAHSMMGHILAGIDDHASALAHFENSIEQFTSVLGADSFRTAIECGNVAACLVELGDIGAAQEWATRSSTIIMARYGDTPQAAFSQFLLGKLARLDGRLADAKQHLLLSIELYQGEPRYSSELDSAEKLLQAVEQLTQDL